MQQQYGLSILNIVLTNLKELKHVQLILFLKTTEGQVVSQLFGSKIYFVRAY